MGRGTFVALPPRALTEDTMTRTIGKMTMLALGFAGAGALSISMTGCTSHGADGSTVVTNDSSGRASFALQIAPNVTVNSATYTITGPNGFSKTGPVDVS